MKTLESHLRDVRAAGRKALVPYIMAGTSPNWRDYVHAAVAAGADAVEIGIPFSDPLMDGVVIQAAGLRALERGTTFTSVCADLAGESFGVPLVAMTYFNLIHHDGEVRAAGRLHEAGISGAILPDLSLEESASWRSACDAADVANILIVAPSTPAARVERLVSTTEGFCYASARMAVTGASDDAGDGGRVVQSIREVRDIPTFIGIGITTPEQAQTASQQSDGVIVGSALVDRIIKGATATDVEDFLRSFREAIDSFTH